MMIFLFFRASLTRNNSKQPIHKRFYKDLGMWDLLKQKQQIFILLLVENRFCADMSYHCFYGTLFYDEMITRYLI